MHVPYISKKRSRQKNPVVLLKNTKRKKNNSSTRRKMLIKIAVRVKMTITINALVNAGINLVILRPIVFLQHDQFLEMFIVIWGLKIRSLTPYTNKTLIP